MSGIWRRRLGVWIPALVFFAANLALFSTYRLVYAGRVESLRGTLEERQERREALQERSHELTELVARARSSRVGMEALYRERLSTQRGRFTAVTAEIRDLARRAGLEPAAMSYPSEEIEDYGLTKRYFEFNVQGTYVELRRFVNFLELTSSFVTLEEVALSGGEGPQLAIRLTLSTFFADEAAVPGPDDLVPPAEEGP